MSPGWPWAGRPRSSAGGGRWWGRGGRGWGSRPGTSCAASSSHPPPHIPPQPLLSETNKNFPNHPHFHTANNQSEIKAWTAEIWYWVSADGVHIGRAGFSLVKNLWSSLPIGCTKSAPQQHGVVYRQCLNCKCCHFCDPMFGLPDPALWSEHLIFLGLWPSAWPEVEWTKWGTRLRWPGQPEGHPGICYGAAQSWNGVCEGVSLGKRTHCWKVRSAVSLILHTVGPLWSQDGSCSTARATCTPTHLQVRRETCLGWTLFNCQSWSSDEFSSCSMEPVFTDVAR